MVLTNDVMASLTNSETLGVIQVFIGRLNARGTVQVVTADVSFVFCVTFAVVGDTFFRNFKVQLR